MWLDRKSRWSYRGNKGLKGHFKGLAFFFSPKRNELLLRIQSRGVKESHCQKLTSYFWATPRRCARVALFFSSTLLSYPPPMSSAKMPLPSLRLSNAPEQPSPVFQSSHEGPPSPILPWDSWLPKPHSCHIFSQEKSSSRFGPLYWASKLFLFLKKKTFPSIIFQLKVFLELYLLIAPFSMTMLFLWRLTIWV